jgi:steroid delta-isomerase
MDFSLTEDQAATAGLERLHAVIDSIPGWDRHCGTRSPVTWVLQVYINAFSAEDLDAIAALFADNAEVHDPVGSEPHKGINAIRAFYGSAVAMKAKLFQQGPTRIASDYAAFAFTVTLPTGPRIDVIDTFRFDAAGKVVEMRAYFGPPNMHGFQ